MTWCGRFFGKVHLYSSFVDKSHPPTKYIYISTVFILATWRVFACVRACVPTCVRVLCSIRPFSFCSAWDGLAFVWCLHIRTIYGLKHSRGTCTQYKPILYRSLNGIMYLLCFLFVNVYTNLYMFLCPLHRRSNNPKAYTFFSFRFFLSLFSSAIRISFLYFWEINEHNTFARPFSVPARCAHNT